MINIFRNEYGWLSNMTSVPIYYKGYNFNSVESAYLWCKNPTDQLWLDKCLNKAPNLVKRDSRELVLPDNWNETKLLVMEELLVIKFNQEPFKSKLIATGNENIQEGNMWGDKFLVFVLNLNLTKVKII